MLYHNPPLSFFNDAITTNLLWNLINFSSANILPRIQKKGNVQKTMLGSSLYQVVNRGLVCLFHCEQLCPTRGDELYLSMFTKSPRLKLCFLAVALIFIKNNHIIQQFHHICDFLQLYTCNFKKLQSIIFPAAIIEFQIETKIKKYKWEMRLSYLKVKYIF